MKIARSDFRWRILAPDRVVHDNLEALALKNGYRVSGICDDLGFCEAYFREIFLRDVGLSPREWMQWERMVMARRMLALGMEPHVVSDRLGFSHPNSFRREFRKVYGVTPLQYMENPVVEPV